MDQHISEYFWSEDSRIHGLRERESERERESHSEANIKPLDGSLNPDTRFIEMEKAPVAAGGVTQTQRLPKTTTPEVSYPSILCRCWISGPYISSSYRVQGRQLLPVKLKGCSSSSSRLVLG